MPFKTSKGGYTLLLEAGSGLSPTDASTYYGGGLFSAGASTTPGTHRTFIPRSGTIQSVHMYMQTGGTQGSNETSSLFLRLNNTTDSLISDAIINNALSTTYSNTSLAIPIAAGDYVELKWVTPTWVTNPTSVRFNAVIYIQEK